MKKRTGFVSNSSSSSFIAVGFKTRDAIFPPEWEEDNEFRDRVYDELGVAIEEDIWGVFVASGLDEMGVEELDLSQFEKKREKVIARCAELGIAIEVKNLKIFYGSRSC